MKKSLLIAGLAITLFACNNSGTTSSTGFKTAYVDTEKLSKEYEAFKELESQSKVKQQEMTRELEAESKALQMEMASFDNEARAKGQQWAQLKYQEIQDKQRKLSLMQESMIKQLQQEFGVKNDTAVSQMKKQIKEYGKKKGYDYIYGSGETVSILYAKDGYDITEEVLKDLNDNYKPATAESKEDTAKTEPAKEVKK